MTEPDVASEVGTSGAALAANEPGEAGEAGADGSRPDGEPVAVAYAFAAALLVLDQATKSLVVDVLAPGRFVPWLGRSVGWQLVLNPGGAFGLPAPHWAFLIVTVVVVAVVVRSLPRVPSLLHASAYGLLLAGALGNAIDRLVRPGGSGFGRGHVVDFVAWGTFPRFNVADSAITIGFLLLVVALWRDERTVAEHGDGAGDDADPDAEVVAVRGS